MHKEDNPLDMRPKGISSRCFPAEGNPAVWIAPNGAQVPLPIVIDNVFVDDDGDIVWNIQAKIDFVDGEPKMTSLLIEEKEGMNPITYSKLFRWGTSVAIVQNILPQLIQAGKDIFSEWLPINSVEVPALERGRLNDEFLSHIVWLYENVGSGYETVLARRFGVSPRTVVSWMEKARKRGLAAPAVKGHISRRPTSGENHDMINRK